ncbi:MAG TPA: YbaK/EbsC family protein [Gaiellaceae bacterium]|nr:YbaK/EbsC family protein [Gaiellaceae bacterium]
MSVTLGSRAVEQGDVVVVSGRRVGESPRIGEVIEVLGQPDHPHYAVRWDDGHQSILYPGKATSIERQSVGAAATPDVAATTKLLVETLRNADVEFELLPHRRTLTATAEARALGVLAQAVAKIVIAVDEEGACVRAVVPASAHVSISKLAEAVSAKTVALMTEADLVSAYPQFELGAVPPFGGPAGDRVVVDNTLTRLDHLVFDGGAHDTSLRMRTEDLITMTKAQVADIAAD